MAVASFRMELSCDRFPQNSQLTERSKQDCPLFQSRFTGANDRLGAISDLEFA
jgi:hypothetical protein